MGKESEYRHNFDNFSLHKIGCKSVCASFPICADAFIVSIRD